MARVNVSEQADIKVLQSQMKDVKADIETILGEIKDINQKLDDKYTTKEEFHAFKRIAMPATVFLTAVITALVMYFFTNIGKSTQQPNTTTTTTTTNKPNTTSGPSAEAKAEAQSGADKQTDEQQSGGVDVTLPKLP
jgi:hypothetical protein